MRQNPETCSYLVSVLAARLRETDEALAATSFLTVKARLARALLELARVSRRRPRFRADSHPSQDQAERPCGDGRGRGRKREPRHERLDAAPRCDSLVRILLSGGHRDAEKPGEVLALSASGPISRWVRESELCRSFLSLDDCRRHQTRDFGVLRRGHPARGSRSSASSIQILGPNEFAPCSSPTIRSGASHERRERL